MARKYQADPKASVGASTAERMRAKSRAKRQTGAPNRNSCANPGKVKTNGRCVWKREAQPTNCRSGFKYAAGPQQGRCVKSKAPQVGLAIIRCAGTNRQCVGTLKSDGRARCMKCGTISKGAAAYAKFKNRPQPKGEAKFCWQHAYQSMAQPPGTGARRAAQKLMRDSVAYLSTPNSYRDNDGVPRQQAQGGYRRELISIGE
jgi:hypothetical protein